MGILADLFTLIAADGGQRPVKGYKPPGEKSKSKAKNARYQAARAGVERLPARVDLRPKLTPVEDQGETNSCSANAAAGAFEYLLLRHQGERKDVSRLYIYYNGRWMADADAIEDEGSTLSDIIEGLKEYGACTEGTWKFRVTKVNEEPHGEAYEEGSTFVVNDAKNVPTDLVAWKTALAAGSPIIFGLSLYDSFDKHRKPGLVPMPTARERSRGDHGGHAMLCVGYSDPDRLFIVRNSWGKSWGDGGYCYIPYDYLLDPEHNFDDSWILTGVEELPPDEEAWDDEEEASVLPDVSSVLADLDDESWQAMLENMGDVPFEQRLALLFLAAAGADGKVSDAEIDVISGFLQPVLEAIGGNTNAKGVLRQAKKLVSDEDLVNESMDRIWESFEYETLWSIVGQLREAAGADGLGKAESRFIDELVAYWELPEEG